MSKENDQSVKNDKYNRYILVGLTIFSVFLAFLFWRSPLNVYDASGHVSLVRAIASDFWPKMSGWNYAELLGWPAGVFYPSLFHWLAATLAFLVGVPVAVKLLISASIIVLPFAINLFTRSLIDNKLWSGLTTLVLFLLLLLFPNFLGTGFRSLFQIGLLSNFFVLPLMFFFLAFLHRGNNYLLSGLLLGLIILTHIVAAIAAGVYLVLFVQAKFLSGSRTRTDLVNFLKTVVLAAVLTGFFWNPFVLNLEYTSVSRHISSYFLPNIAVFAVSLTLGFYAWRKKERNIFILSMFASFIAFVAAVDAYLIRTNGTSFFLYQFHIYRFQPFAYLFFASGLLLLISKYIRFDAWGFTKTGSVFGGLGLVVLILLVNNPAATSSSKLEITDPQGVKGRFLETFRRTESDPFWYAIQTGINVADEKATWAYGLFTDSSPNGPYLGSLIRSLNPQAYPEGDGIFLEEKFIGGEKAGQFLSYLSINQLINLERTEGKSIGRIENAQTQYFNVEKAAETRVFEIAPLPLKPIKKDWNQEVEDWWLQKEEITEIPYLANGKEILKVSEKDLQNASVEIVDTNKNQTRFELKIDSERQVPVIAKISYFPYWKATQDSKEIPIYQVAPNLMLIEAKGSVVVEYKEPVWVNWLYLVSAITFLGTVLLIYRQKPGIK